MKEKLTISDYNYNKDNIMSKSEKNQIDEWLQTQIRKGINIVDYVCQNKSNTKWELYYTGHLHKDILDNFPGRTNKKIFAGYKKYLNKPNLMFTQKKFDEHGYNYYVRSI